MTRALLLIDLQNDFMPGGTLAVPEGHKILPIIDKLLLQPYTRIIATQDSHPEGHCSFAATFGKNIGDKLTLGGVEQILWPIHCLKGSPGADFAPGWHSDKVHTIIYKGSDKEIDSYSAFFDNGRRKATELESVLRKAQISTLIVAGVATDYCVKYSVLDALSLGFEVYVVTDACQAVNVHPGDDLKAFEEMRRAGAHLITSEQVS